MKKFAVIILAVLLVACKKEAHEYRTADQLTLANLFAEYSDKIKNEKNWQTNRQLLDSASNEISSFLIKKNLKFTDFVIIVDDIGDFFGYTKLTYRYDVFKEDLQANPIKHRSINFVDVFQKTESSLKKFEALQKGDTVVASGKFLTKNRDNTKVSFKDGLEYGYPTFEVMILDVKKK